MSETKIPPMSQSEKREVRAEPPSMSVVIPAFNEQDYIPETIDHLRTAEGFLKAHADAAVQILVVDNGSTDQTVTVARDRGVVVICEADHNIAKARNTGARAAAHDVLIFLDADTLVPPALLVRIGEAMIDPGCVGGAVDAAHRPARALVRAYLKLWRVLGLLAAMAQGACQFCRRQIFIELGGYDEALYMGEDVDFYWRLRRLARQRHGPTCFIRDLQVVPAARRFDRWPLWRTLVWTSPPVVYALRRHRLPWAGWYRDPPR